MVLLVKSLFLLGCSNLLLYLRDPLALLPMAILRTIPVNLLAVPTAIAIRLASFAELTIGAVQRNTANLAALPKDLQGGLDIRNIVYKCIAVIDIARLCFSPGRNSHPKLCLRKSI